MRRSEALRLVALAALASCSVSRDAATAVSSIAPVTNRSTIQSAVVVSAAPSALLTTTTSTTSTSTVTTTTVTTTTVTTTTVTTTTVTTPDIERMRIVYGTAAVRAPSIGSIPLRMDLYLPTRPSAPVPVVVIIHGGGYRIGSRADPNFQRIARGLAAEGIAAASIDYRLIDTRPVPSARVAPLLAGLPGSVFDAAMVSSVDDTITAIDYLRTHAREFGLDVDRLGLVGGSAGAITADHIAYVLDDHGISGPRVRFVASLWGGILIPAPTGHGDVAAAQLNHGEAALFAVHGDHDSSVRVALDDELVARATAEHVPVEYERIAGGEHSFEGTQFFTRPVVGPQTAFDRLLAFAAAHLR